MKKWILILVLVAALVPLIAALVGVSQWLNQTMEEAEPERISIEGVAKTPEKKATLNPGRVIQLITNRGVIDFVLFEEDCPVTTKRIADFTDKGKYDGVEFCRAEQNFVIQTAVAKKDVKPIKLEALDGLINAKGSVGLAHKKSPNSGTSSFYILREPAPHLNYKFAVFGRVIKGMDVVMSIKKGDVIKSAKTRKLTPQDMKLLDEQLQIESERRVN